MFGLNRDDLDAILSILREYPSVSQALMFGSRAIGTQHKGSDVDIALKGEKLDQVTSEISSRLNHETLLPYRFDIVDYAALSNPHFIDHIDHIGVIFYTQ